MYTVAVKIEGMDRRRRTTGLMHLMIGFFLLIKCFDLYNYLVEKSTLRLLPFVLAAAVSLFYGAFRTRIDGHAKYNGVVRLLQFTVFVWLGIVLNKLGHRFDYVVLLVWAMVTFLMFLSEKRIFEETSLRFTDEGIRIPGTYKEHMVQWSLLDSVTVRHDFITLFHRDKKYLQYQVMQDLSELEVVKMNAFCKEKIEGQLPLAEDRS